jgi:hypothetical protein
LKNSGSISVRGGAGLLNRFCVRAILKMCFEGTYALYIIER